MNRRAPLAGLVAAAPATAIAMLAIESNPDAELIELGCRYHAACAAEDLVLENAEDTEIYAACERNWRSRRVDHGDAGSNPRGPRPQGPRAARQDLPQ